MQITGVRPYLHLRLGEFTHTETGETFIAVDALYEPYRQLLLSPHGDSRTEGPVILHAPSVPPGIYRHFKHGNRYRVFGEYMRPETGEVFVAYAALYAPYARMVRPTAMWHEHVDRPEIPYQGPRFTLIRPC